MDNAKYKISPSDFAYLWNDCKHCYYQKVKFGVATPGIFPSMFRRINDLLQTSIMGKNLQEILPSLPSGIIEIQEGYMQSKPLPVAPELFIKGRFDILSRLDDGTYAIIDFKIALPDVEKIQKYASQLHAYKFALENPEDGDKPYKISKMGVVTVNPESMKLASGKIEFTTTPAWHPVEENMESFYTLIKDISTLLKGDLPQVSKTCMLCLYRKKFEPKITHEDEIPF